MPLQWDRRALVAGAIGAGGVAALGALHRRSTDTGTRLPRRGPLPERNRQLHNLSRTVNVRDFGATGNGRTNDTAAFTAASRAIERAGGGTLLIPKGVYSIGRQQPSIEAPWSFAPAPVIDIRRCAGPVAVIGEGAVLRCVPGLKFGTFARDGRPTANAMPFTELRELATPYRAAIWLQENRGGVAIGGLEIDGAIDGQEVGGPWGDTGWQINHCGLWLYNNRGPLRVDDVNAHHHGQDGIMLFAELLSENDEPAPSLLANVRANDNGRQGLSLTGGRHVTIRNCEMNRNGRTARFGSAPGAGIDLEEELSFIRDIRIQDSEFIDNSGQGLVADNGKIAHVRVENCLFVGVRNYALWPHKPGFVFRDCEIVGAMTRCFEDPSGGWQATRFERCRFHDQFPTGMPNDPASSRVDLGGSGGGTLFSECEFAYQGAMQLPYSPNTVRYHDCHMLQRSPETSYPRGIYTGRNVLSGNVSIDGSRILGEVLLNGRRIARSA